MTIITENKIGFVKSATVIISFVNLHFIGDQYQKDEPLELIYFIVVLTFFVITTFWTLGVLLAFIRVHFHLKLVIGMDVISSLIYLGGTICFVVDFGKEDQSNEFPTKKIISSIFGFVISILYACGMILSIKYASLRGTR